MDELPGEPAQVRKTDQQCEHCRRWFDSRGLDSHQENCPVVEYDFLEYDEKEDKIVIVESRCSECGMWSAAGGHELHREECSNYSEGDVRVKRERSDSGRSSEVDYVRIV